MNLDKLDFQHPECGGFCTMERELLFFVYYNPDSGFWDLKRYLVSVLDSAEMLFRTSLFSDSVMTWVRFGIIENPAPGLNPPLSLTSRGREIVERLEAGGW